MLQKKIKTDIIGLGLGFRLRVRVRVRVSLYDISLSYMTYLPVSHSIPLTIILRSAFCVLYNTPAGLFLSTHMFSPLFAPGLKTIKLSRVTYRKSELKK